MDFGIFNIMQQRNLGKPVKQIYDEAIEQTQVAEALGFDKSWYAEHHFSNYSLCPSPLMMVGHMAARTSRIRLGTAVVVAPLYNPSRLLAEIGMVDVLSDGRLELGIGMGYQGYEFDRFGIDLKDSAQMTGEIIDMVQTALSNDAFDYEGQYFRQPRSSINVRPQQRPLPPIWYAGGNPEHLKKIAAGEHGLFISGVLGGVTRMKGMRANFEQAAAAVGKNPDTVKIAVSRMAFPSRNKKDVEHFIDCARYQQRLAVSLKNRREDVVDHYLVKENPYDEEPSLESILRNLPVGDVDTCIERMVRTIRELKPVHVMIQTQVGDMDHRKSLEAMELWATEVIPGVMRELEPAETA